jgi:hypothetical protein
MPGMPRAMTKSEFQSQSTQLLTTTAYAATQTKVAGINSKPTVAPTENGQKLLLPRMGFNFWISQ